MSTPLKRLLAVVGLTVAAACANSASASIIRGVGNPALIGGDLTDPENNGDPENNVNYNATFTASEEPNFGGSEGAFNVFDNQTGGGNNKWCCGDQNNFPTNPISIDATFPVAHKLTRFTLTAGNDTPDRDPRVWSILGSNDGANFTTIFSQNNTAASVWTVRDQVIEFDSGVDYPVQATAYTTFRFLTTATNLSTGARFQLEEIEYFEDVPEPGAAAVLVGLFGVATATRRPRR